MKKLEWNPGFQEALSFYRWQSVRPREPGQGIEDVVFTYSTSGSDGRVVRTPLTVRQVLVALDNAMVEGRLILMSKD